MSFTVYRKVFLLFYPQTDFTVELMKPEGGGLGFTVAGGASTTGGCFVKAIVQDPALSDGRLKPGDQLLQVTKIFCWQVLTMIFC